MKCDELFVYCKTTCDPQGLYYSKSEVDEAIAELKDGSELDAKTIAALKSEADKVIAWHKYRRCLAMAYVEWLKQMILCNHPESILYRRAIRRERKWKEMAQKFKEAK